MLGLYLSIPFCRSKCTFCNFASGVFPASYFDRYVARLVEDMAAARACASQWGAALPETVDSIYFGGGTPSLLPAYLVRQIMAAIHSEFTVLPGAEITFEAAPAQLSDETLAAMVECGANRLSFGVQSFVDAEAQGTGRLHGRADVFKDVARARAAGIDNLSLDLLAGLPGQTRASWRESLTTLAETGVGHASVYMLEVDDESKLGAEMLAGGVKYGAALVPGDDAIVAMYEEAIEALSGMGTGMGTGMGQGTGLETGPVVGPEAVPDTLLRLGLAQYEISNFAQPGRQSRHNRRYWERKPYLGLGVDAHSMLRDREGRALRFATTDELQPYLEHPGWSRPEPLSRAQELEEAWFLGLRLNEGVDLSALQAEFGREAVTSFDPVLDELAADDLVIRTGDRAALTQQGQLLSNEVFERFLASEEVASSQPRT